MHMEPGVVSGAKMVLGYATAATSAGIAVKFAFDDIKKNGAISLLVKSCLATFLVFVFFEVFPHYPIGVSEVHFILGSMLFLIFGIAAAAIGLAGGLLIQGIFFAPWDLSMYPVNVTTLLMSLFAMRLLAKRVILEDTPYTEIKYLQALKLSTAYQCGIISWVAFWALYGQGFGVENLANVFSFGGAYLSVLIIEPVADLAVLACAKMLHSFRKSPFVEARLYNAAG